MVSFSCHYGSSDVSNPDGSTVRDLVVLVGYEWSSCRVVLREEQRKEVENR